MVVNMNNTTKNKTTDHQVFIEVVEALNKEGKEKATKEEFLQKLQEINPNYYDQKKESTGEKYKNMSPEERADNQAWAQLTKINYECRIFSNNKVVAIDVKKSLKYKNEGKLFKNQMRPKKDNVINNENPAEIDYSYESTSKQSEDDASSEQHENIVYLTKYSQDLKNSKNIIFHGAPGTGKTFLAKQIAAYIVSDGTKKDYSSLDNEQKQRIGFVQFHPNYDYSDFVEGLRPILSKDGESMSFKLVDGIFKKFVDRARKDFEEDNTSKLEEDNTSKLIETFFNKIADDPSCEYNNFETKTGIKFKIKYETDKKRITFVREDSQIKIPNFYLDKVITALQSNKKINKPIDLKLLFENKEYEHEYSYIFPVLKKIREIIGEQKKNKHKNTSYVFIIDEINRGEISKIFGELFFSIDPGYRGLAEEGVMTQYHNMHGDQDYRFYIPDNVYIIGTMNDIDRSVDSFDFAMRRRFRFIDIKANDNIGMLDELEPEKKEKAKARMRSLNGRISEIEGLNDHYHIGAAYFLKLKDIDADTLWKDYLEPLLEDYVQGMPNEKEKLSKLKNAYYNYKLPQEIDQQSSQVEAS